MKLFLSLLLVKLTYGIQECSKINETIADEELELKICTSKNYNNRFPSDVYNEVETFVRVLDFVQLDWNENAITIFLQLFAHWNDTRIQLNDKYVIHTMYCKQYKMCINVIVLTIQQQNSI